MGKSHALQPLFSEKVLQAGCWALWWMLYMYYIGAAEWIPAICNLTGESSAIHDCPVAGMPQIKKCGGGGGWGTMFNQNWEKKEKCGIEN